MKVWDLDKAINLVREVRGEIVSFRRGVKE